MDKSMYNTNCSVIFFSSHKNILNLQSWHSQGNSRMSAEQKTFYSVILMNYQIKMISAQRSSSKCKNYVTKKYL